MMIIMQLPQQMPSVGLDEVAPIIEVLARPQLPQQMPESIWIAQHRLTWPKSWCSMQLSQQMPSVGLDEVAPIVEVLARPQLSQQMPEAAAVHKGVENEYGLQDGS